MTFPNCNFLSNYLRQISSQVGKVIVLYYASTLDFITTFCFLLFQRIKLLTMKTQYLEVDLLSKREHA